MKKKTFKILKKYFEKEKSVLLAFLFGSFAKDRQMRESDVDIAIYFKDYNPLPSPLAELKRPKEIGDLRRKIWRKLTQILEREVDLICLNEAPAPLVSAVFKTGIPLKIGDEKLYWELYLRKSLEAEDFLNFVEDFWGIYKKARSISPEAKEKVRKRFQFLDKEMRYLEDFSRLTLEDYRENESKRRDIERWVEWIINALIDIAKIVLASEKKEIPNSYGDALFDFGLFIGLGKERSERLSEFAELRNILAHEYLEVIYGRIQNFIKKFPSLYKKIFQFLEKYLEK